MNRSRLLLSKLTQSPFRNVSTTTLRNAYCTTTVAATLTHNTNEERNVSLYRRISPLGNPNISIKPVLDQWINQGHSVDEVELRNIVTELTVYRRFKHALEVLTWMTEKRFVEVTATDAATRLDLISRVYGVEAAENYFNLIPTKLKTVQVYHALLKCYAYAKCVEKEKAEGVMQKMRDLGFASYTLSHNVMLNLYCRTHNRDKIAEVLLEMEANNIKYDTHTYGILMNTYGGVGDIDGLERILTIMESDTELDIDWMRYAVAAKHYIGAQLEDKALESLRKSEKLVMLLKKKNEAYTYIANLYGDLGKKEEVFRVWKKCKKYKTTNRDYMSLFRAVLKFNDVETAENLYKEWEDRNLSKDIRIPNFLIRMYCEQGLIEKAEALLERLKLEKWENPNSYMWSWMSFCYVKRNQMNKAVEAMKSALSETNCQVFRRNRLEGLVACLKYLKDEEDSEEQVNAIIESLKDRRLLPANVLEKLVEYLSGKGDIEDVLKMDEEEETSSKKEHELCGVMRGDG